ncbi:AI-2E family transporter [Psychromarinibacter sp. S121]|uniref:AI-2E family transporter n=1 Tax=Psychromarinibacter sp. S121 TaxID=3415127 RepID=UPI003C7C3202
MTDKITPTPAPPPSRQRSRELVETTLPILALLLLLLLGFTTVQPFLPAILWGIFLSVSLRPVYERLTRTLGGRRGRASIVLGLILTVLLVLPILGLSRSVIAFIPDALIWFSEQGTDLIGAEEGEIGVELNPITGEITSIWDTIIRDLQFIRSHFGEELKPAAFWLIREGRFIGVFVMEFALGVLLAIILLHRAAPLSRAAAALLYRVGGAFGLELADQAVVTIRSTVLGVLGSAAAQAAVASVAYFIVGVPHWPILALLTLMLGLIQVGPILVWLPIAFWLWSNEAIGMAIFMCVWGLLVVGLTDNVVKSFVVSRGAHLPAILALFGAIGGMLTWGVVGIFLGPVILAVCYQLVTKWMESEDDPPPEAEASLQD